MIDTTSYAQSHLRGFSFCPGVSFNRGDGVPFLRIDAASKHAYRRGLLGSSSSGSGSRFRGMEWGKQRRWHIQGTTSWGNTGERILVATHEWFDHRWQTFQWVFLATAFLEHSKGQGSATVLMVINPQLSAVITNCLLCLFKSQPLVIRGNMDIIWCYSAGTLQTKGYWSLSYGCLTNHP